MQCVGGWVLFARLVCAAGQRVSSGRFRTHVFVYAGRESGGIEYSNVCDG